MSRNACCYEVLIASPSDVRAQRQIIVEAIEDWNSAHSTSTGIILQPRRWELDAMPETGERPQDVINRQVVDSSDILLGVFWSRLGTPTGVSESGTVEEIDRLVAADKPASLYFYQAAVPIGHDHDQLTALLSYKNRIRSTALYFEFHDLDNFRRLVSRYLAARMNLLAVVPATTRLESAERTLLHLQEKMRGREITSEQIAGLRASTADSAKGIVTIQKFDQDPEAVNYARQLFCALEDAGWTPVFSTGRVIGGMEIGLRLSVYSREPLRIANDDEDTSLVPPSSSLFYGQNLKNCFKAVGIAIDHYLVQSGPPIPKDSVYLSVGPKPLSQ